MAVGVVGGGVGGLVAVGMGVAVARGVGAGGFTGLRESANHVRAPPATAMPASPKKKVRREIDIPGAGKDARDEADAGGIAPIASSCSGIRGSGVLMPCSAKSWGVAAMVVLSSGIARGDTVGDGREKGSAVIWVGDPA